MFLGTEHETRTGILWTWKIGETENSSKVQPEISAFPSTEGAAGLQGTAQLPVRVSKPRQCPSALQEWGFDLVSRHINSLCLYRIYGHTFFPMKFPPALALQSPHPSSWTSSLSHPSSLCAMQKKDKRELKDSKCPSPVNSDWKPSSQTRSGQTFN